MTTIVPTSEDRHPLGPVAARALDLDRDDAARLPALLKAPIPGGDRVRLTAVDGDEVIGAVVGSVLDGEARLDLIVVDPARQRSGVGRALLMAWESVAESAGATLLVGGNLHPYAWPGVDIRYTAALSMLLRTGYRRDAVVYDMDVTLPLAGQPAARPAAGIVIRRAQPDDRDTVRSYLTSTWTEVWTRETLAAIDHSVPTLFLAEREGRLVGFGAHGVHRKAWFGPLATDTSVRGLGIGDALQRAVLGDMASGGVTLARIGWVAEDAIPFYSRTIGARLGRCYWTLEKVRA